METIKFLDATLRDGGNRNDFRFTPEDVQQILIPLDKSGVDYIEIGYRNGAIHPIANIGVVGECKKNYLLQCAALIHHAKIAVMAHPQNISEIDLQELKDCGVKLFRICLIKGGVKEACSLVEASKQYGFEVSVNFIHVSYYTEEELDAAVAEVTRSQPDMIYFADSNGSLLPTRVQSMYEKYTSTYSLPFGFHAHDNLGLAQMNTLTAIQAGARYIDGTLAGMGKGIGNLRTEYFIAYLQALGIKKYNLENILPATNYVRQTFDTSNVPIDMDEFIRGISDLSTADLKRLKKQ